MLFCVFYSILPDTLKEGSAFSDKLPASTHKIFTLSVHTVSVELMVSAHTEVHCKIFIDTLGDNSGATAVIISTGKFEVQVWCCILTSDIFW